MSKKIYISGKISGIENEAERLFSMAEIVLLMDARNEVINPLSLSHEHDLTWLSYMKVDIKALIYCDSIYLLDNWIYSKGAIIGYKIAKMLGLEIVYQKKINPIKKWLYLNFNN